MARQRPLTDALLIRRGKNKGKLLARISEQRRAALELIGRERALIYKTLVLTGLRKGELASLKESQVKLEHDPPLLELNAADEKNAQGNSITLRDDLAAEIAEWLGDKAPILLSRPEI